MYLNFKEGKLKDFILNPKTIKFCIFATIIIWFIALPVSLFIAFSDPAGPKDDVAGFSIFNDFISNLGSIEFTPYPFLTITGFIIWGLVMTPVALYFRKIMKNRGKIVDIITVSHIVGNTGIILTGIISIDLANILDENFGYLFFIGWHESMANLSFWAFLSMSISFGIFFMFDPKAILLLTNYREKIFGFKADTWRRYIIILSFILYPVAFFIFIFAFFNQHFLYLGFLIYFWEWILDFTFIIWYYPLLIIFLLSINDEIKRRNANKEFS